MFIVEYCEDITSVAVVVAFVDFHYRFAGIPCGVEHTDDSVVADGVGGAIVAYVVFLTGIAGGTISKYGNDGGYQRRASDCGI